MAAPWQQLEVAEWHAGARAYSLRNMSPEKVQPGFRRTAIRGKDSLVTINWLEAGLNLTAQHSHSFDQLSFVLSGTMKFFVGTQTFVLDGPAVLYIPADVLHGAEVPLDSAQVLNIDVFAPVREDYEYLTDYQALTTATAGEIFPLGAQMPYDLFGNPDAR